MYVDSESKQEFSALDPTRSHSLQSITTAYAGVNFDSYASYGRLDARTGLSDAPREQALCASHRILAGMDRLWTPWRYQYIAGAPREGRRGVPEQLADWPGEDRDCVFCNLAESVRWGIQAVGRDAAEQAGLVVAWFESCFVCLNRFPYSSGHLLLVPYCHKDSLASLQVAQAEELMRVTQHAERALRAVYRPDGVNLGMNLGEAAGAGVAGHLHLHALPRWSGDGNFMTVIGETRILPETLETTWQRLRGGFAETTVLAATPS